MKNGGKNMTAKGIAV